jgi:hypothetical protein
VGGKSCKKAKFHRCKPIVRQDRLCTGGPFRGRLSSAPRIPKLYPRKPLPALPLLFRGGPGGTERQTIVRF